MFPAILYQAKLYSAIPVYAIPCSTKCQYHALASKPKWWILENWKFIWRYAITLIKVVPIITCNPWNPVATKNVLPYTLSDILKGAKKYSIPWRAVKYTPKKIVNKKPIFASIQ